MYIFSTYCTVEKLFSDVLSFEDSYEQRISFLSDIICLALLLMDDVILVNVFEKVIKRVIKT